MLMAAYLTGAAILVVLVLLLVLAVTRQTALLWSPMMIALPSLWAMVQVRCKLTSVGDYPCGFMAFQGGFTWEMPVAAAAIVSIALLGGGLLLALGAASTWREALAAEAFAARGLLGLAFYAVWVTLPVPLIHFPEFGGVCPSIPLLCHDIPVLGLGGAFWWAAPAFLAAAWGLGRLILGAVADATRCRSRAVINA